MATRRYFVTGRVQGVFFRASARNEALRLGITGYAGNLPDGRVEIMAVGNGAALDELERWLRQGPPGARVDALAREELPEEALHGFLTF